MEEKKSGLPKIPIENQIKAAIEFPEKYTTDELKALVLEWEQDQQKKKDDEKARKRKETALKNLEKIANRDYNENWKAKIKVLKEKLKNIKIPKRSRV